MPASIHDARLSVMADLPALAKDGRNETDGYDFRSADAVIAAVRPLFVRHGITATPRVTTHRVRARQLTNGGTAMHATVEVTWRFTGPAGDHDQAVVIGEAMDQGDKALSKAQTVAQRIAWSQWLAIPTHEIDPDATTYQVARPARPARTQPRRPRPEPTADAQQVAADQLDQLARLLGRDAAVEFWTRGGPIDQPRAPRVFEAMLTRARKMADQQTPTPDEWAATLTTTEVAGHLRSYGLEPSGDLTDDRALLVLAATADDQEDPADA